MIRALFLAAALPWLAGCDTIAYYGQAIGGHFGIMAAARPVETWLADPATPPTLRNRLETARRIRAFASSALSLPDNASYTSYADLGRPYVVWNVFAAAEFSVQPRAECFPFTGCVGYRGFFSLEAAQRHAAQLAAAGHDVYVGGVPAYSTLGWFDDPLLSTFIGYPDAQLARLLFHELAHQVAYARNDTTFNESFAVVVEEEGVRRWLAAEGRSAELRAFREAQARRRLYAQKVKELRDQLAALYASDLPPEAKRARKAEGFAKLRAEYPRAVPEQPSNAFLVSVALYTEQVPQFEALLRESGSLEAFYARVRELAATTKAGRPSSGTPAAPAGERTTPRD
jgi:predicted aminopeptidase